MIARMERLKGVNLEGIRYNKPLLLSNRHSRNKAKCTLPPINPITHTIADSPVYNSSQYHQKLIRFLLRMSQVLEPLRAVTHNLPGVIRQPLIALIGTECYTSLVWYVNICCRCCIELTDGWFSWLCRNLDLSDTACLKYSASKVLGIGLVAGGRSYVVFNCKRDCSSRSTPGTSQSSLIY